MSAQQQQQASNYKAMQALKNKGAMTSLISEDNEKNASKYVGMFVLGFLAGKVAKDDNFNIVPNVQFNVFGSNWKAKSNYPSIHLFWVLKC